MRFFPWLLLALALVACGDDDDGTAGSTEAARRAYLGLDLSIDKAISLGFDGFNAATNANIPPQTASGDESGTMTVAGTVDQGSSDNKTMKLHEVLVGYSDDGATTYDNAQGVPAPELSMKLSKIPNGTLEGSLNGTFTMSGEQTGNVVLSVTFSGQLEPKPGDPSGVQRKPGTTRIVGTARYKDGTYPIDVTR